MTTRTQPKDYYAILGVPSGRHQPTSRRPTASSPAITTPTSTPRPRRRRAVPGHHRAYDTLTDPGPPHRPTTPLRHLPGHRAPAITTPGTGRPGHQRRRAQSWKTSGWTSAARHGRNPARSYHHRQSAPTASSPLGPPRPRPLGRRQTTRAEIMISGEGLRRAPHATSSAPCCTKPPTPWPPHAASRTPAARAATTTPTTSPSPKNSASTSPQTPRIGWSLTTVPDPTAEAYTAQLQALPRRHDAVAHRRNHHPPPPGAATTSSPPSARAAAPSAPPPPPWPKQPSSAQPAASPSSPKP